MNAYLRGVIDGFRQPYELTMGLSWDDLDKNESYDRGVNLGQRLRSPLHHQYSKRGPR